MRKEDWMEPRLSETESVERMELDARITDVLDAQPGMSIPEGFAARVAAQVPARHTVRLPAARYGYRAMWVCAALLLAALLGMAAWRTGATPWGASMEWMVFAELAGVVVWLSLRHRTAD